MIVEARVHMLRTVCKVEWGKRERERIGLLVSKEDLISKVSIESITVDKGREVTLGSTPETGHGTHDLMISAPSAK
jgi:hypothetical protein